MNRLIEGLEPQAKAFVGICLAVAEAIRDLKEVPSGVLYAHVMGHMTLEQYEAVIDTLLEQNLIERDPSHLLRWIGPAKETP